MLQMLSCSSSKKSTADTRWKLVWGDEFNYTGMPDTNKWTYEVGGHGWGNNEKQYYLKSSPENSYVKEGNLHIVALKKDFSTSHYTSAKLSSWKKFSFQYGKVEARVQVPKGKGTWPAVWMLPETIMNNKEPWPLCGEIDIMEHVGKDPDMIHTTLHSQLYNHVKKTQVTHFDTIKNVATSFHVYAMEWTPDYIRFTIDGQLFFNSLKGENDRIFTNEGWPFDKPYFLLLNLAIGGNWGGDIDDQIFPAEMLVDYIRVYK